MDRMQYLTFPILDVPEAIALGRALLQAAPDHPEAERGKAKITVGIDNLESAREQIPQPIDRVSADRNLDTSWRAFYTFSQSFTHLAPFDPELAQRSQELHHRVFGDDGLRFVRHSYNKEWVESKRRLDRIDETAEADYVARGGAPFLDAVRQAHQAYGEALGLEGEQEESIERADLRVPLQALRDAIQYYTIGMLYLAEDEASEKMVTAALKPLLAVQ